MERHDVKLLIVGDSDMNCDVTKNTIQDMTIGNVGFTAADLGRFDMVIYVGAKGTKILKSKWTASGIVGGK